MDAVPGMPTYFVFTPTKTTVDYRAELKKFPEYNVPDPADPEKMLWETFDYELACSELCGRGHYSMKRPVKIVSQEEYDTWLATQSSYYFSNIRFKESDPWTDRLFDAEFTKKKELLSTALSSENAGKDLPIEIIAFKDEKGNELLGASKSELSILAGLLKARPSAKVKLSVTTGEDNIAQMSDIDARTKAIADMLYENGVSPSQLVLVPTTMATEDNATTKWVFTLLGAGLLL